MTIYGVWGSLYNHLGVREATVFIFLWTAEVLSCVAKTKKLRALWWWQHMVGTCSLGIDQGKRARWSASLISSPVFFWRIMAIWTLQNASEARKKWALIRSGAKHFPWSVGVCHGDRLYGSSDTERISLRECSLCWRPVVLTKLSLYSVSGQHSAYWPWNFPSLGISLRRGS